jgi:hypothetical protein
MAINMEELVNASTYAGGDQTYVAMHDAVARAIDPEIFNRFNDRTSLYDDEDHEWLNRKADEVLDALNALGFLSKGA